MGIPILNLYWGWFIIGFSTFFELRLDSPVKIEKLLKGLAMPCCDVIWDSQPAAASFTDTR